MKSQISAPHTIAKGLKHALALIGSKGFAPNSDISRLHNALDTADLDAAFLDGTAAFGTVTPINEFLKAKGFSIQLPEKPLSPNDLAFAGVLDIKVSWAKKGTVTTTSFNDTPPTTLDLKTYKAFNLDVQGVYKSAAHSNPVYELPLKGEDGLRAFVTRADAELPADFVALQQDIQARLSTSLLKPSSTGADRIIIPHVNLQTSGELSQFTKQDLTTVEGGDYYFDTGIFEGKLELDENGAVAKAAAAGMMMLRSVVKPPVVVSIDGPFYFWFTYGNSVVFAAHIFSDALKAS